MERPNRIPQEAIELDYVRRANQSRPKSLTRTVRSEADYGYSRSEKAKPIRARRDVENLVGLGIPTPLVSKQLGHQATAEVATMGIDISDRYVSMIAHDRSYPSDSDDEKNVPYPAPFLSNYHAIPARQRQVSCRQQAEPRSRFLHNLQPVSDDSSFPNSPTSSFDVGNCRKRSDYYVTSLKSKQQYLGNIEKAYQAHELISNCSTGTPASSTDMSSKRARQRSRGQSKAVPDKSNASARSVSSDDESGVGNGNGISRPAIQQQIADEIVRQPVIFMTKLRLGPLPAEPCHAADTGRKSRDSNQSSLSSAASNYDDESALVEDRSDADEMYYSSMDSSVTVSSTSQSMRQYSRNKW